MILATKKKLVAFALVAGTLTGIPAIAAEGEGGSVLSETIVVGTIAGPQGPYPSGNGASAYPFAYAPTPLNPLAAYSPAASTPPGLCWFATDQDRGFGYWAAC